jgi:putative endonuclease
MAYFVYILESESDGSYYVGHTANLGKRIDRHNEGGGRYTRGKLPWKLIYHEVFDSRGEAMKREREIKGRKDRDYINELVRTLLS